MTRKQQIQRLLLIILIGVVCIMGSLAFVLSMKTVQAEENDFLKIQEGASVRLVEGSSGIRFKGEVKKAYITQLENKNNVSKVTYGIVITPKFYLDSVSGFTIDALSAKYKDDPYLKIPAEKSIDNGETYEFCCAMIGLNLEAYRWEFAAKSYIEIVYDNKTVEYVYSDFNENANVRSIKNVAKATLEDTSRYYSDEQKLILKNYVRDNVFEEVYISSSGSDENLGTKDAPYATLSQALDSVADNGVVVVCDSYTVPSDFQWKENEKSITIKGDEDEIDEVLNFTDIRNNIVIGNDVTFDDVKLDFTDSTSVFANGHKLVINEGVKVDTPINLYGGGNRNTVTSTDITVNSGNYYGIFGGGYEGTVTGNTKVYVGGTTNNSKADLTTETKTYNIYGGGYKGSVADTSVIFAGKDAKAHYVCGGAYEGTVRNTEVTFCAGKAMSIYGGNIRSNKITSTNVEVTGGEIDQIFGANYSASMEGSVDITITGGTVARRIYGGCYNDGTTSGLSYTWKSDNHVTGNVCLTIGTGANITFNSSESDRGVFGGSRYKNGFSDEVVTIVLLDGREDDILGRYSSDFLSSMLLGSPKVYDYLK